MNFSRALNRDLAQEMKVFNVSGGINFISSAKSFDKTLESLSGMFSEFCRDSFCADINL